jgi:hypothetical protein
MVRAADDDSGRLIEHATPLRVCLAQALNADSPVECRASIAAVYVVDALGSIRVDGQAAAKRKRHAP